MNILVDNGVLLNLVAADALKLLQAHCRCVFYVPDTERQGMITFRNDAEVARTSLQSLADDKLITFCSIETERESCLFVDYCCTHCLNEAAALTLAQTRGWILATDSEKVRKQFNKTGVSDDRLITTLGLFRKWEASEQLPAPTLSACIEGLANRALFEPDPTDQDVPWWNQLRSGRVAA